MHPFEPLQIIFAFMLVSRTASAESMHRPDCVSLRELSECTRLQNLLQNVLQSGLQIVLQGVLQSV